MLLTLGIQLMTFEPIVGRIEAKWAPSAAICGSSGTKWNPSGSNFCRFLEHLRLNGCPGEAANEIHAPSLQPVHKNEGGWRHHQVAVVSMGVPRRPQMRYTHQVHSLRTNARGVGSHCRVTVGSMGAPRNPQMRGTHQLRSLRTKSSGAWGSL